MAVRVQRPHPCEANGLIYDLIAFLIIAGFRERRFASFTVAAVIGFLYGGTLFAATGSGSLSA